MREIKFRAWDNKRKYMVFDAVELRQDRIKSTLLGDNYEFMQFTGVTDKNGREIYEGDIISYSQIEMRWRVKFHDGAFLAKCIPSQIEDGGISMSYISKFIEVIGNIRENPELLKEKLNG